MDSPLLPNPKIVQFVSERYKEVDPSAFTTLLVALKFSQYVTSWSETYFQKIGISFSRYRVLVILFVSGESMSPARIADSLTFTRATITGLIDTLESDGLVERLPDPDDRRGVLVRMTEAGGALMDSIQPQHHTRIALAMSELTDEERSTLLTLFTKFHKGLELVNSMPFAKPESKT